jgi:RNA polymerase sigma factor for flagellar operon FliA
VVSEEEILAAEPYVAYAARQMVKVYRIPFEDLTSAGMIGVMKAAKSFDPSRGVKFTTYAQHRIRGSILDEIRTMDRLFRNERDRRRGIQNDIKEYEGRNGIKAPSEMYDRLGNHPEAIHIPILSDRGEDSKGELYTSNNYTRESLLRDWDAVDPFEVCLSGEEAERIRRQVKRLPERFRVVIEMYYFADMTLQAIADSLGCSKTHVWKERDRGLRRLREELGFGVS